MTHPSAVLQSTDEPPPTTARHVPFSELQSTVQFAPQLAPHDAAELQSTLQASRQAATQGCVSLLQSTWHALVVPQSIEHAPDLSHLQLAPEQLPEVAVGVGAVDGGAGAPTVFPPATVVDEPLQAAAAAAARRTDAADATNRAMETSPRPRVSPRRDGTVERSRRS
jgi:hypothetical protein